MAKILKVYVGIIRRRWKTYCRGEQEDLMDGFEISSPIFAGHPNDMKSLHVWFKKPLLKKLLFSLLQLTLLVGIAT